MEPSEAEFRKALEDLYSTAYLHGFENQVLMRPQVVFNEIIRKLYNGDFGS